MILIKGTVSNLSPQQWQQLAIQSKGAATTTGQPQDIDQTTLNIIAKELAMMINTMLSSMCNTGVAEGNFPDGEIPLLDGAKAVVEAIAKMIKITKDLVQPLPCSPFLSFIIANITPCVSSRTITQESQRQRKHSRMHMKG